jgi:hypothetical protein
MALQPIQPVAARPKGKSAIENAYKAFDLATTMAGLFGKTPDIYGVKGTVNQSYFNPSASAQPLSTDYFSKFYLKK